MSEQDPSARQPDQPDPAVESPEESTAAEQQPDPAEEWPVRRALIRATLTPQDGAPPAQREPPVFTMHQQTRGGAGGNRANGNVRSSRPAWDNGNTNRGNEKGNSSRASRRNDRGGQPRNGSQSRSASSRRGRGRSR